MKKILDRLQEFRKLEPVRFDAYLRRGVMALAALVGIALDADIAGFIVAGVLYLVWGVSATESVRSQVTPNAKVGLEPSPDADRDEG